MQRCTGLPGQSRKDKRTTDEIKVQKGLGANSGKWVKELWPPGALDECKAILNEATAYHDEVTFPFGGSPEDEASAPEGGEAGKHRALMGVGILPAALITEYGNTMRAFAGKLAVARDKFLDNPMRYVTWAMAEHNGTFDPKNYPGCTLDANGQPQLDEAKFKARVGKKFLLSCDILPVPDAEQFTAAITALIGTDAESVNLRVRDAEREAQAELLRRMTEPVLHMASKLSGQVCHCRSCKGKPAKTDTFKDTLVGNVKAIADLVPKMNLSGDAALNAFAQEMEALTRYSPDTLRSDDATKAEAAEKAADLFKRLSGYKI